MQNINDLKVTADQSFYDREPVASAAEHDAWMREIEFYFNAYSVKLNKALAGTAGVVAELGAGSCGLSICASRLPSVKKIHALDISSTRMDKMISLSSATLGGDPNKISPKACDFNSTLPFEDATLQAVLFDAALHHSRSMWGTLAECHRVLKTNGLLIAQRESYLSIFRARRQLRRLQMSPEVAANVSENMYLKEQYEYYLQVAGFTTEFIRRTPSRVKSLLKPLNGVLFSDGILFCTKREHTGYP